MQVSPVLFRLLAHVTVATCNSTRHGLCARLTNLTQPLAVALHWTRQCIICLTSFLLVTSCGSSHVIIMVCVATLNVSVSVRGTPVSSDLSLVWQTWDSTWSKISLHWGYMDVTCAEFLALTESDLFACAYLDCAYIPTTSSTSTRSSQMVPTAICLFIILLHHNKSNKKETQSPFQLTFKCIRWYFVRKVCSNAGSLGNFMQAW